MSNNYVTAYCSPKGPISEKLNSENINYYSIKKLSYWEVKKIVKKFKPDIIHAHDNRATVIASLFSKKCKIISHIHGNNSIMNYKSLKTRLFDCCSKKVDKFIWVSDSSLNDYCYKENVINKSIVLYNTIDDKEIITKSKEFEIKQKYDLIFLGRLAYPKNPERLIEIINIVKNKKKDITLAIVGDGVDRIKIENMVKELSLEKNVTFYAFQKNPYPFLKKSKILLLTSLYEGTPMCALEAQSLGKPIIATPVDGLKKLIINDVNGYLTDDNNLFSQKIIEFLKKENRISKIKARLLFAAWLLLYVISLFQYISKNNCQLFAINYKLLTVN